MLLITCVIFGLLGSLTWAGPRGRTTCPSGTFAYKYRNEWNCYQFYEDELTFEDAEQECQFRRRGHLASFNSDRQTKSIGAYVTKENMESHCVWIGLRRDARSSMITGWRWIDGSRSTYRNWSSGEPNHVDNDEFCVNLETRYGHVTWNDLSCSSKCPFLCKWKPT